ncbi:MAG: hypothetical protein PHE17_04380 [Thiothrix sp.]|uniref:hypothetical protein n=1 Tax=Thiothrix sp. TaxID=1032 RepID=UPI002638EF9C|nr:hypothetical protein [Thiothrix sp.]MDD5392235.1 hypothetical protein [Thiothrix sp.]
MPKRWLQIKGDPSVRAFLFQQERQVSLFDENIDKLHRIMYALATRKGVFNIKVHYSSSQLSCWFFDDPYSYKIYVKEEVFESGFLDSFPTMSYEGRQPRIDRHGIEPIFDEFKRLRLSDEQIYLRSASINRINGMIGMNFSCDGSHYIEHEEFFRRLKEFGATNEH